MGSGGALAVGPPSEGEGGLDPSSGSSRFQQSWQKGAVRAGVGPNGEMQGSAVSTPAHAQPQSVLEGWSGSTLWTIPVPQA